jgi:hypothetical protein
MANNGEDKVHFTGRVEDELPSGVQARLKNELAEIFQRSDGDRVLEAVTVTQCFAGHTPEFAVKVVLAVEVRYRDGYDRHIVKLGRQDKVSADFRGWEECTKGRMIASRIFAPVRAFPLPPERVAVV